MGEGVFLGKAVMGSHESARARTVPDDPPKKSRLEYKARHKHQGCSSVDVQSIVDSGHLQLPESCVATSEGGYI